MQRDPGGKRDGLSPDPVAAGRLRGSDAEANAGAGAGESCGPGAGIGTENAYFGGIDRRNCSELKIFFGRGLGRNVLSRACFS